MSVKSFSKQKNTNRNFSSAIVANYLAVAGGGAGGGGAGSSSAATATAGTTNTRHH